MYVYVIVSREQNALYKCFLLQLRMVADMRHYGQNPGI